MNTPVAKSKELSCALLVESHAGWLIAHVTGTPRWDLPKGRIEEGEIPIEAALRECLEETGLDFQDSRAEIEDLGRHGYLPRKDLHLFRLKISEPLDLSQCCCSTYTERRNGRRVPETDDFAWVKPEIIHWKLGKSLVRYLRARGLLTDPGDRAPSDA